MNKKNQPNSFGIDDYPLAEKHAHRLKTSSGRRLSDLTLEAVTSGDVKIEDLRITSQALLNQAEISRQANRHALARNFERAPELVDVPQEFLLALYELLRPGRATDRSVLLAAADRLRVDYKAERMANFFEEAADVYQKRGLYK